jgi:hypothetical protein
MRGRFRRGARTDISPGQDHRPIPTRTAPSRTHRSYNLPGYTDLVNKTLQAQCLAGPLRFCVRAVPFRFQSVKGEAGPRCRHRRRSRTSWSACAGLAETPARQVCHAALAKHGSPALFASNGLNGSGSQFQYGFWRVWDVPKGLGLVLANRAFVEPYVPRSLLP